MANATVTFVKDATSAKLMETVGSAIREVKHQASLITASGQRIAYDKGVVRYEVDLDFESLTITELEELQAFYHTTTDGVVETWTYTDTNGVAHTARFLDPVQEVAKVAYNVYDVHVKLELDDYPK